MTVESDRLKGVFSKPSGNVTKSLFFELDTSNFGCLLIFYFAELCKVSARLHKGGVITRGGSGII